MSEPDESLAREAAENRLRDWALAQEFSHRERTEDNKAAASALVARCSASFLAKSRPKVAAMEAHRARRQRPRRARWESSGGDPLEALEGDPQSCGREAPGAEERQRQRETILLSLLFFCLCA